MLLAVSIACTRPWFGRPFGQLPSGLRKAAVEGLSRIPEVTPEGMNLEKYQQQRLGEGILQMCRLLCGGFPKSHPQL